MYEIKIHKYEQKMTNTSYFEKKNEINKKTNVI